MLRAGSLRALNRDVAAAPADGLLIAAASIRIA
jgi:hypothetical protein